MGKSPKNPLLGEGQTGIIGILVEMGVRVDLGGFRTPKPILSPVLEVLS